MKNSDKYISRAASRLLARMDNGERMHREGLFIRYFDDDGEEVTDELQELMREGYVYEIRPGIWASN